MRVIAQFSKTGIARFVSHLDLLSTFQRALRRAGIDVAYSAGFNPHMQITFASALPVGVSSEDEYIDVELHNEITPENFIKKLNDNLPDSLCITRCRLVEDLHPCSTPLIKSADYSIRVINPIDGLADKIATFTAQEIITAKKWGKNGPKEVDIKPMIYACNYDAINQNVLVSLAAGNDQSLKPMLFWEAFCAFTGVEMDAEFHRVKLYAKGGISPFDV